MVKTNDENLFDSDFDEMVDGWLPKVWRVRGSWQYWLVKDESYFNDDMVECINWLKKEPKSFWFSDMTDKAPALNEHIRKLGFNNVDLNWSWGGN